MLFVPASCVGLNESSTFGSPNGNDAVAHQTYTMKVVLVSIALTLFLLLSALTTYAQSKTYKLTVFIPEIAKRTGKVYIGLATNDDTFTGSSWKTIAVDVPATGETTAMFDNLPAGTYAVRVYQDINDNKQLDRAGMMPSEPFGFSKIVMLTGPPVFSEAAFELTEDMRMKVLMQNQEY